MTKLYYRSTHKRFADRIYCLDTVKQVVTVQLPNEARWKSSQYNAKELNDRIQRGGMVPVPAPFI